MHFATIAFAVLFLLRVLLSLKC